MRLSVAAVGSQRTWGKTLVFPHTPLALLNALMALRAKWRAVARVAARSRRVWGSAPHPASFWKPKGSEKQFATQRGKGACPTNYNFSFCSSNTLGRNYIGPSNRADMFQILIFRTNFPHCLLNATAKSGIINNRQREIQCRQLIWSEANEYTKEKAITYRKGSRDHC